MRTLGKRTEIEIVSHCCQFFDSFDVRLLVSLGVRRAQLIRGTISTLEGVATYIVCSRNVHDYQAFIRIPETL